MKKLIPFLVLLFVCNVVVLEAQRTVYDLRNEYLKNPIGIDVPAPRFSWKIDAQKGEKDVLQTAYQIQVVKDVNSFENKKKMIWDSGKVLSDQSVHVVYQGPKPKSRERFYWRVRIWDNKQNVSTWSKVAFWEMGLLKEEDWVAKWIEAVLNEEKESCNPAPMLRNTFSLKSDIKKARLYITSHGLYEASLNGYQVTDQLFTPGWTSYKKRLQYQVYDVTKMLSKGNNAVGIKLGDGWFRGEYGWENDWNFYGDKLALLFQLEVEYKNGKKETIISDENWASSTGPILLSSIYDGEIYNANLEEENWATAQYDQKNWGDVQVVTHRKNHLIASVGVPVKRIEVIKPRRIINTPKGEVVIDMGQNMVGRIRFKLKGNKGDSITIYHAEVLDKFGNFYTKNLRNAAQMVRYIFKGDDVEIYEPTFTFQGFQYIMIEDYKGVVRKDDFEGIVIHSDMPSTGTFECSHPLINQLQSNIRWGQKGNFLDVPTDCPQRDERMGWTGDAQVFTSTACFNHDAAAFYTKWLGDFRVDQKADGAIPFVVPDVLGGAGAIGWADAATIIPWVMYQKYGDIQILENQYSCMRRWVDYLDSLAGSNHLVQDGFHFGDWLFFIHPSDWNVKPGYTDIDLLGTAFLVHSSRILANAAQVLGKEKDELKYRQLSEATKTAFQLEFITGSGRLSAHSQTGYAIALAFDLYKDEQKAQAVEYLVQNIKKRNFHLSTGFLGTPHLNPVLSENGYLDVAYKLLMQEEYPSWLYPVTKGATTIWERWDGIKPDSTFQLIRMNSFNHYAYGAIGDWMYTTIAGIKHDPQQPGYKHIIIEPLPGGGLTHATATYESLYGQISSKWQIVNEKIIVDIIIPPNTTATILLPKKKDKIDIGSGEYHFEYVF